MSEGYEHTSDNQVNIQIKLCVHPTIISKGTKTWIERSLSVVTWLRYKRNDICGTIEFKWPSIREHSFYLHSKDEFYKSPLNSKQTLGVKIWYTSILTTNSILGFFFLFLFLFLFHVHIFFFSFLFVFTTMLSWSKLKGHRFTWQLIYIYLFSPTWNKTYPIWMFPYSMEKRDK